MRTVLTIAGFDPSSGAGVTADLMVLAAHGFYGVSCITNLTVQSTQGVISTHPVDPGILGSSLRCLAADLDLAGIKLGMMSDAMSVGVVSDFLSEFRVRCPGVPVVLDPVILSSSGKELLDSPGVDLLRTRLLPLVDWITPNLDELSVLSGLVVASRDQVVVAAGALQRVRGEFDGRPLNVVATGGHLVPPDDLLLAAGSEPMWLPGKLIESSSTHGTGCAYSSALLSRLVLGDTPLAAARAAKAYVAQAILTASPIGRGKGPLNLLWPLK